MTKIRVLICAVALLVALRSTNVIAEPPPTFVLQWGSEGSGDGQFNYPHSICVDATGDVFVGEGTYQMRIQKFTGEGVFLRKWGRQGINDGQFGEAIDGIAIGPDGTVYVSDFARIQRFTSDGGFIGKWGSFGSGDGQFSRATGVATDGAGNVYVADGGPSGVNQRIQKFTSEGEFLMKWGGPGSGNGQFEAIFGIVVDSQGNVYASDFHSGRIQKFTGTGQFLQSWGRTGTDGFLTNPADLAIDGQDNIYIANAGFDRIVKFTNTGMFLSRWGDTGSSAGQFDGPLGVAVGKDGAIFVADSGNRRIQKFSAIGPTPVNGLSWGRIKALYR